MKASKKVVESKRTDENEMFVGSKSQIEKVVLFFSIVAMAVLFIPFFKTGILAVIACFAIFGAKDQIKRLSLKRKRMLFSLAGVFSLVIIFLWVSMFRMIVSSLGSITDPETFAKLKAKSIELFYPTIKVMRDFAEKYLFQLGDMKSLEAKLVTAANWILDLIVNFFVGLVAEVPNNTLQFLFFVFLLLMLLRNNVVIKQIGAVFLPSYRGNTLEFLITTAKFSGFHAVVAVLLTALAQAFLLTLGAAIAGVVVWPMVFVAAFFSAMVPVVGVLPLTVICAVYAGSEFGLTMGMVAGLFGVGAMVIDNVIRPFILSSENSSINPVLAFFAIVGSLIIFGFSGLLIGPFVLVFTSGVFKRYKIV